MNISNLNSQFEWYLQVFLYLVDIEYYFMYYNFQINYWAIEF